MGKLEFNWNGEELIIGQCDKMKTSPQECELCKHRFVCFTERVEPNDTQISSTKTPKLSDMLRDIQVKFNVDVPSRDTDN